MALIALRRLRRRVRADRPSSGRPLARRRARQVGLLLIVCLAALMTARLSSVAEPEPAAAPPGATPSTPTASVAVVPVADTTDPDLAATPPDPVVRPSPTPAPTVSSARGPRPVAAPAPVSRVLAALRQPARPVTTPAPRVEPARSGLPPKGGPSTPVTIEPADGRAGTAIRFALGQLGLPYVWGGNGPLHSDRGFDCSGLTHAAYAAAGIPLPRTAHTQYYAGPRVPAASPLMPGDLVFYGVPSRVHHVGLYLGGGRMVNAPTFGKPVRVASVRYRGDDYLGATRPAAAPGPTGPVWSVPVEPPTGPTPPPSADDFPAPPLPAPTEVVQEPDPAPLAPVVTPTPPLLPFAPSPSPSLDVPPADPTTMPPSTEPAGPAPTPMPSTAPEPTKPEPTAAPQPEPSTPVPPAPSPTSAPPTPTSTPGSPSPVPPGAGIDTGP